MLQDEQIVGLYWNRDPDAIAQTDLKYGAFCMRIAKNILRDLSDAEECVNDTYLKVWDSIPPQRPSAFSAFLGRIIRNLALDRYRYYHAQKRQCQMETLLSELETCIPDAERVEDHLELQVLTAAISDFLQKLSKEKRIMFVQRYWYGESIQEIAKRFGTSEGQIKSALFRLRAGLRRTLEKEGILV